MINFYYYYYFFFKKTYKQIAYKFGRKNPIAIPDMYVLTLGSKRQKKKSYIGNIFYSIREHFDEWVSIQYLLTNEMSELKLS